MDKSVRNLGTNLKFYGKTSGMVKGNPKICK